MTTCTATAICPHCDSQMQYGKIEYVTLGPDGEPNYHYANGMSCELCGLNDDTYEPDGPETYDELL